MYFNSHKKKEGWSEDGIPLRLASPVMLSVGRALTKSLMAGFGLSSRHRFD